MAADFTQLDQNVADLKAALAVQDTASTNLAAANAIVATATSDAADKATKAQAARAATSAAITALEATVEALKAA
jgi:hypothetical protein